jgi:hypothetical protein
MSLSRKDCYERQLLSMIGLYFMNACNIELTLCFVWYCVAGSCMGVALIERRPSLSILFFIFCANIFTLGNTSDKTMVSPGQHPGSALMIHFGLYTFRPSKVS